MKLEPNSNLPPVQDGAQMTLVNYTRPETCELPTYFIRTENAFRNIHRRLENELERLPSKKENHSNAGGRHHASRTYN